MNRFERHLNWTGGIIALATCVLYVVLMQFAAGGYSIENYLFEDRGQVLTIIFLIITYGFLLLNMTGLVWVLRKKRLRSWFLVLLLLFVPLLISTYTGFAGQRYNEYGSHPLASTFMSSCLLPVPWIIALSVKKMTPVKTDSLQPHTGMKLPRWIPRASTASVLLILIATSIFSFVYVKTATTTYEYLNAEQVEIPRFSFKHPVSFIVNEWSSSYFLNALKWEDCITSLRYDGLFQPSNTEVHIGIFQTKMTNGTIPHYLENELAHLDFPFYPLFLGSIDAKHLEFQSNVINGREFSYTTFENSDGLDNQQEWGTISLYGFEEHGFTWIFELRDNGKTTEHPPEWFTRMLESFTIYDN